MNKSVSRLGHSALVFAALLFLQAESGFREAVPRMRREPHPTATLRMGSGRGQTQRRWETRKKGQVTAHRCTVGLRPSRTVQKRVQDERVTC